uniref:MtN3-like protein n=1 Tax=Globisporangium ultimum (strain ATCC 200006 / CBS 805.95 / DAOM BR144) TaxID=431595 RepID=K3X7J8_GLOUD
MLYGYLSGSIFPLFVTFIVGDALAIGYLSVYYRYTTERAKVRKLLVCLLLWNVLITLVAFSGSEFMGITHASKSETGDVVGYIADTISVLLYASPFATLARVIKTKSVATIPIAMVVVGACSNSLWVIYGFYISDMIVVVPNVICVTFGCVQTIVYAIYRPKTSSTRHDDIGKEDLTSQSTIDIVFSPKLEFQVLRSPN